MQKSAWWQMWFALASVTLRDRALRRRFITGLLVFIVAYFAFGVWGINAWLERDLWRMLIFWGFLGCMLLFTLLCALYDALAAIGEERTKAGLGKSEGAEESSRD